MVLNGEDWIHRGEGCKNKYKKEIVGGGGEMREQAVEIKKELLIFCGFIKGGCDL